MKKILVVEDVECNRDLLKEEPALPAFRQREGGRSHILPPLVQTE